MNGALSIWHTEVAPYSMGYEVTFRPAENRVTYSWACYCSFFDVAEQITQKIENAMPQVDVSTLLAGIAWAVQNYISSFVLETDSGLQPRGYYTGHVANVRDVHQGIALDGIILGHFQGDYSSMTTGTQNDIVRALVALKGFCLDCIHRLPSRPLIKFAIAYLKDHGTDISTPEKLNVWIKENPDKCALPENRVRTPSRLTTGQTALNRGKKQRKNEHER